VGWNCRSTLISVCGPSKLTAAKLIARIARKKTDRILGENGCAGIICHVFPRPILGLSGSSALPQFGGVELPLHPAFGLWTLQTNRSQVHRLDRPKINGSDFGRKRMRRNNLSRFSQADF
jgi:hypothetical protein